MSQLFKYNERNKYWLMLTNAMCTPMLLLNLLSLIEKSYNRNSHLVMHSQIKYIIPYALKLFCRIGKVNWSLRELGLFKVRLCKKYVSMIGIYIYWLVVRDLILSLAYWLYNWGFFKYCVQQTAILKALFANWEKRKQATETEIGLSLELRKES